ncbi:MAG TPA: CaiB/BaiF CoA-transferase family protein [Burkholderiales bacterium]|nr:CaiB/BaiF CoA-transferase family protein [Burkholderiales bacterium]
MSLPFKNVRVLDLTNVIAGPLASYQFAMLGADVIKIETPGTGDLARKMGADPRMAQKLMGASFCALNAGKRSMTLNLKSARGKDILKRLVKDADVVLENFRPGTMKKLGLDYPVLKEVNPGIIYCAVSGFGQHGPLAQRPSYDQIIQGFCGIMSLTGDQNTAPIRAGYLVCDTMAAMTAAFAVAAALFRKKETGAGEMIDVSMLDSSLATMASWIVSNYLNAGKTPVPMGNENHTAAPSGTFRTGKGLLNIVNNEQKHFERLCEVVGRPELKTDPKFAHRNARLAHREELRCLLEEVLQKKSAAEWERLFDEASVPAGPILTVPEILAHPQVASRELIKRFTAVPGADKDIGVTRLGFRLASGQPDVDDPPPQLGKDTAEVLRGIGYSDNDVEALRRDGVI